MQKPVPVVPQHGANVIERYHLKLNRYEENQFEKKKRADGKYSHFYKEIRDLELIMKHRSESVLKLPMSERIFSPEKQLQYILNRQQYQQS